MPKKQHPTPPKKRVRATDERLLTVVQLAKRMDVNTGLIYQLTGRRRIPFIRAGRRVLYRTPMSWLRSRHSSVRSPTSMRKKKKKSKLLAIHRLPAYIERLTNDRPSLSTVWRWVLKGTRGRKLQSTLVGGRRYTQREWVRDFLTNSGGSDADEFDTWESNWKSRSNADRYLEKNGL